VLAGEIATADQVPDHHRPRRLAVRAEGLGIEHFLQVAGDAEHGGSPDGVLQPEDRGAWYYGFFASLHGLSANRGFAVSFIAAGAPLLQLLFHCEPEFPTQYGTHRSFRVSFIAARAPLLQLLFHCEPEFPTQHGTHRSFRVSFIAARAPLLQLLFHCEPEFPAGYGRVTVSWFRSLR